MDRSSVAKDVLAKRAARFGSYQSQSSERSRTKIGTATRPQELQKGQNKADPDDEFERQLVGTCEQLEKCYLRLTTAPKETEVRPRHVLVKALQRAEELWEEAHNYRRVSELLKSIRQDMTVQGIRDQLSIDVYETHAMLALHSKDAPELNVCLSALESLYEDVPSDSDHRNEFVACRILYYLYTQELADLTSLLGAVLSGRTQDAPQKSNSVDHAINVSIAWFLGSYHKLLQLYQSAPFLSSLAMELFLDRERRIYFSIIMTAYRPSVPKEFISSELVLSPPETSTFLSGVGAVFTDSTNTKIDCKSTLAILKLH